ncbi:TrbC/VirB2 family protein [Pseudodesulfovibrio senegalensis]|uniref:TrbC/VirB2 family protein n=1 Tax=Pseudodesulfovibrio senegalensis TaxID=1721087 RepID=UPI001F4F6937|nr:TrbC/VirB2 family protein [Pseudodesulfovibrio senegalensis]
MKSKNISLMITIILCAISLASVAVGADNPFDHFEDKGSDFIDQLLTHAIPILATLVLIGAAIGFMAGKVRVEMFARIFISCLIASGANEIVVWMFE